MSRRKSVLTEVDAEKDRQALARLNAPVHRARILGLVAAGHPLVHVIAIGQHHGTWTERDVWATLDSVGVRPPSPPFGGGSRPRPDARPVQLTEVQIDVLREMCTGANAEIIAARLFLSKPTIHRHIAAVLVALKAEDRAEAIALVLTGRVRVRLPS